MRIEFVSYTEPLSANERHLQRNPSPEDHNSKYHDKRSWHDFAFPLLILGNETLDGTIVH
jgi:hypothetical protein